MKAASARTTREVEELVTRFQGRIRGFLVYLGCPADRLDDLLQDVFLSFLRASFEHRAEAATAAFLRRIARNVFLKWVARERRELAFSEVPLAERVWRDFEGQDGGETYLAALRECLSAMRGRSAEVLRRRYEAGQPLASIAAGLGLAESGVKSILLRAKRKLRACIERRISR